MRWVGRPLTEWPTASVYCPQKITVVLSLCNSSRSIANVRTAWTTIAVIKAARSAAKSASRHRPARSIIENGHAAGLETQERLVETARPLAQAIERLASDQDV